MGSDPIQIQFSDPQRDRNALRAFLKLLPNVGDAIDRMLFGLEDEKAQDRLQQTVDEVRAMLDEQGKKVEDMEDWHRCILSGAPAIGTATNEDKRERFRKLLFNAAQIPAGDEMWEEAFWCMELLKELRPAALAVLANAHLAAQNGEVFLLKEGEDAEVEAFTLRKTDIDRLRPTQKSFLKPKEIKYKKVILREAIAVLRSKGLITFQTMYIQNIQNQIEYSSIGVASPNGTLLVRWTIEDF